MLTTPFSMSKAIFRTLFFVFAAISVIPAVVPAQDEPVESSAPMMLRENNSLRALIIQADNFRGTVPRAADPSIVPGQRVMIFLRNVALLAGESANAFRVYGEDAKGRRFRFVSESLQPLRRLPGTFALTFILQDEFGYYGQPDDADLAIRVTWRGNTSENSLIGNAAGNEKLSAMAAAVLNPPTAELATSTGDRKRFMEQAAFGPSAALDFRLKQIGPSRWITEQFDKPYPTIPYPNFPLKPFDGANSCGTYGTSPEVNLCHRNHYWNYNNQTWLVKEALYSDAQLRRRVSWALHQIWVVSHNNISQQRGTQEYFEILDRNAFGNYRTLMTEMTLSPAMGEFLDMVRSTRFNPNENYPRELLQLFSIGLYMLNQDGTLQRDSQNNPIPTYDQAKIEQFTKVFTGWTHCNSGNDPRCANAVIGIPNYVDPMILQFPSNHDLNAKSLFDYPGAPNPTIAACTTCTNDTLRAAYATDSLNRTLDNIFYHPNVGPFVGKLLIQHLVTSDPSPAYVARVAAAFNNNGAGVRGDMKAVIRAVLLDPEARGGRKTDPNYGKLREPFQYMTNFLRQFNVKAGINAANVGTATPPPSCQGRTDGSFDWMLRDMGQEVWVPPTVFSYFSPEYVVPGTSILGPEFGLANTGSSFARNNHVYGIIYWGGIWFSQPTTADPYPWVPCGTSIDMTEATAWAASDPTGNALIEGLNAKLMHGTMSQAMKDQIRNGINVNVSAQNKAQQAIFLAVTSSQFQIQR